MFYSTAESDVDVWKTMVELPEEFNVTKIFLNYPIKETPI